MGQIAAMRRMEVEMKTSTMAPYGLMALALAACGGGHSEGHASSDHSATTGEGGEHTASTGSVELHNACVLMMHRERECSDVFVPALVALRVRMDHPVGIAARDAADHAALITSVTEDYRHDSTDERIAATCRATSEHPAEHIEGWIPQINACVAMTDCAAFVACDMRFTEARFGTRMEHDAAHPPQAADAGAPTASTPPATTAH